MRFNQYVRDGEVQISEDEKWGRVTCFYGKAKYDPRTNRTSLGTFDGMPMFPDLPLDQIGAPNELVFHTLQAPSITRRGRAT